MRSSYTSGTGSGEPAERARRVGQHPVGIRGGAPDRRDADRGVRLLGLALIEQAAGLEGALVVGQHLGHLGTAADRLPRAGLRLHRGTRAVESLEVLRGVLDALGGLGVVYRDG